jgi:hypothetical protein
VGQGERIAEMPVCRKPTQWATPHRLTNGSGHA